MKLRVFSKGPLGETVYPQSSHADVHIYAERLIRAGHDEVRVGTTAADAIAYDVWRAANLTNVPQSIMTRHDIQVQRAGDVTRPHE